MARVKLITKSKKSSKQGAERRRAASMAPRLEAPTDGGIKLPEPQTSDDDNLPNPEEGANSAGDVTSPRNQSGSPSSEARIAETSRSDPASTEPATKHRRRFVSPIPQIHSEVFKRQVYSPTPQKLDENYKEYFEPSPPTPASWQEREQETYYAKRYVPSRVNRQSNWNFERLPKHLTEFKHELDAPVGQAVLFDGPLRSYNNRGIDLHPRPRDLAQAQAQAREQRAKAVKIKIPKSKPKIKTSGTKASSDNAGSSNNETVTFKAGSPGDEPGNKGDGGSDGDENKSRRLTTNKADSDREPSVDQQAEDAEESASSGQPDQTPEPTAEERLQEQRRQERARDTVEQLRQYLARLLEDHIKIMRDGNREDEILCGMLWHDLEEIYKRAVHWQALTPGGADTPEKLL
jgi:hypothetical protein